MSKKCYRFFGGLLNAQAKWLNKMSEKGYQLVRTGTLLYEFEKCKPGEVTYCVEFIGEKSKENATDYADFLEDMGYKVFFKNINLNYSVGKVRWRPWAERGGRIATEGIGITFHNYHRDDPNDPQCSIDYIILKGDWELKKVEKWTEQKDGVCLSGHFRCW